jgi:hypothetical protein
MSPAALELSWKCIYFFVMRALINRPAQATRDRTLDGKINRKGVWIIKATMTEDMACFPQGNHNSFSGNGNHFLDISMNLLLMKPLTQEQVRSEQY